MLRWTRYIISMHDERLAQHFNRKYCSSSGDRGLPKIVAWYAYPLLEFIEGLDFSRDTVFEYGSGSSSVYWAKKAKNLFSVEHDESFCNEAIRLSAFLGLNNLRVRLASDQGLACNISNVYEYLANLPDSIKTTITREQAPSRTFENLGSLGRAA